MSSEDERSLQLEAALNDPEVRATKANLLATIKSGKGAVFLTSRFERGAKVSMQSQELGPVNVVHNGNGGHHDMELFNGLGFKPNKDNFEGFVSWASVADNRADLQKQGVLHYDGVLERDTPGGAPMLVTLITDRNMLQKIGFDGSLNGYCLLTAEVSVDNNKMLDSVPRGRLSTTMKYIVPTAVGEDIARLVQKVGPAAAWAIMFDSVGYKLKHGSDTDYGIPYVNLTDTNRLGVAYIRDKGAPGGATQPQKRKLFGW